MANIKSAKKRIKVIATKNAINKSRKSVIKTYLTKFNTAIENNEFDTAKVLLKTIEKKLGRASAKGTMHKNKAARNVSSLTKKLNSAM